MSIPFLMIYTYFVFRYPKNYEINGLCNVRQYFSSLTLVATEKWKMKAKKERERV